MKRNRNFLLIVWAASLLGLSAVQTAAGYRAPGVLGVYESPQDTAELRVGATKDRVHSLLSRDNFDPGKDSYDLISAYKSRSLVLSLEWGDNISAFDGITGDADVKVFVNDERITATRAKGEEAQKGYNFNTFGDSIYVIPFGSGVDSVKGKVEVTLANGDKLTYEAVIKRGVVDDITALRNIWITDSIKKGSVDAYQDTIFKEVAGADGKLKPGDKPWEVSFKDKDDASLTRGRADTLYFTKYDALSTVKVIVNNRDTLKLSQKNEVPNVLRDTALAKDPSLRDSIVHIGSEIYKVKIHAGNSYAIEVTARDTVTKDYYHIILLDDTFKTPPMTGNVLLKTLKDLYLYEGDQDNPSRRYTLKWVVDTNGVRTSGIGFKVDIATGKDSIRGAFDYRVTVNAPWSAIAGENPSIKVGYDLWDDSPLKDSVEVFQSVSENKKFIKVFVKEGGNKTAYTYTIEVLNGNTQLKSFRLSSDLEGLKPLELTRDSAGDYTSAAVDYTVDQIFAWAALEESTAKLVDKDAKWIKIANDEYRRVFDLKTLVDSGGGNQTFSVPVVAEDTTVTKIYKVKVKMNWDPTPDKVTFSWSSNINKTFSREQLRAGSVFDVSIPKGIEIEDIKPEVDKKNSDLFRVFKSWQERDGVYSYTVKVTAREDGASKTYTFNVLYPSNDASLSHLYVPGFELSPAFDSAILAYTVIVPNGQTSVNFIAQTSHPKATIAGDREHTLHGDSTFKIVVTAEDKSTKTYTVTVTGDPHTGIQLAGGSSVQVYVSGQSLHVSTPAAERVSVYSAGGQLLYSLDKPAGKAFVSTFPKGVLIVKGSSGWVKKVALH
jgi:hypothetical protein